MNNNPNRDEGRKEKNVKKTMNTWTRRVTLGAFITMNLAPRVMRNLMMQTVPLILLALVIGGTILAEEPSKTRPAETPAGKDAFFDWQKLNAAAMEEYRHPPYLWKPGMPFPGGRGIPEQGYMSYMYAPNFAFEAVPGAKHYRFTVTHCEGPGREYRVLV